MKILVTGGAGFIGSNFIKWVLANQKEDSVVNLDSLTYAGNLENLAGVEEEYGSRYRFVKGDILDGALAAELVAEADAVAHFAAESHVDRSIVDSAAFVRTNVQGTHTMLNAALNAWEGRDGRRFLLVSTDEVYGALKLEDPRRFKEDWPLDPKSPYSASKAGADLMGGAYHHTFGLPVMITRCSNNYGPYQFPEKLIPLMILNTLNGKDLPVYGDGMYVRDWIYVTDNCRATYEVLLRGDPGQAYNIGGNSEKPNIEVVRTIIRLVCERKGLDYEERLGLIRHVKDRPGHDRRYAIDAGRLKTDLGVSPKVSFEEGIAATVDWYLDNDEWTGRVLSGEYQEYYRRMYSDR